MLKTNEKEADQTRNTTMEKKKGRKKKPPNRPIMMQKRKTNVMNHERPHNQQRRVDVNKTFLLSCVCPLNREKTHEKNSKRDEKQNIKHCKQQKEGQSPLTP